MGWAERVNQRKRLEQAEIDRRQASEDSRKRREEELRGYLKSLKPHGFWARVLPGR